MEERRCERCGRKLTSKLSRLLHIGPVCRARKKRDKQLELFGEESWPTTDF